MATKALRRVPAVDAFGRQVTQGARWWFGKVGPRWGGIDLLGSGEMDGIDRGYYGGGHDLPEFDANGNRNWKFHSSDPGVEWGPLELIPGLPNFKPKGLTGVEWLLPQDLSDAVGASGQPDPIDWFLRALRVPDYTLDGGGNLVAGAKIFSANNALVSLFIGTRRMKLPLNRFHGASWLQFRDACAALINYDGGTGLTGEYYTPNFGSLILRRNDAYLDFTLQDTSPWPSVPAANFSARYTGQVIPLYSETYTFYLRSDDGARLWVNGVQLVNDWTAGAERENSGTIALAAGVAYTITVEYFQQTGPGRLALSWQSASQPKAVIPQTQLKPAARTVERYNAHVAFPDRLPAPAAFASVLRRAPGWDWQDVNGKIKMLGPTRPVAYKFTYDQSQALLTPNILLDSFALTPRSPRAKPNYAVFSFYDLEDPFYTQDTVVVDRRASDSDPIENPLTASLGVCTRSLASRIAETEMNIARDLAYYTTLSGWPDSWKASKCDLVEATHEVAGTRETAPPQFMVTQEKSRFGAGGGDNRDFALRIHDPNYYSDDAQHPIKLKIVSDLASPYVAPPAVTSVVLTQGATAQPDNTYSYSILGGVQLSTSYPYPQRARVYWQRQGDPDYRVIDTPFFPNADRQCVFQIPDVGVGMFNVKVIAETLVGIGIALAAALATSCTITNQQLPAVTGLVGHRGTADRTLIVEWQGTPQLTPQAERYEAEIWRATSPFDFIRTFKNVSPANNQASPVLWYVFQEINSSGRATISADGTVEFAANLASSVWLKSQTQASPVGGLYFEYTVPPSADEVPTYVAIHPVGAQYNSAGDYGSFFWTHQDIDPTHTARAEFSGPTVPITPGDRLGIELTPDGRVRYYKNRTSEASVPVYESNRKADQTSLYTASVYMGGGGVARAEQCRFLRFGPEIVYTDAMQRNDFGGSVPASVTVKVYQLSPSVLSVRGLVASATFS